ncbi:hypothetical protein JW916_09650 [Candidatus Sumerlaeota bacterium]|nr:hypothetical protein [Candidatus Sumerlaeota bacterium]
MFLLLLCLALCASGCSLWNPWGYKKEWPLWKKTLFFAGPGHCPVCYCVGGAAIELGQNAFADDEKAQDADGAGVAPGPSPNEKSGVALPNE